MDMSEAAMNDTTATMMLCPLGGTVRCRVTLVNWERVLTFLGPSCAVTCTNGHVSFVHGRRSAPYADWTVSGPQGQLVAHWSVNAANDADNGVFVTGRFPVAVGAQGEPQSSSCWS